MACGDRDVVNSFGQMVAVNDEEDEFALEGGFSPQLTIPAAKHNLPFLCTAIETFQLKL